MFYIGGTILLVGLFIYAAMASAKDKEDTRRWFDINDMMF